MGLGALTPLFLQTGNAPLAESNAFYQHQLQSAEAQAEQQRAAQAAEQTQEAQATAPLIQQQEQLKLQQAQQQLASQKQLQATMQNLYGGGQQPPAMAQAPTTPQAAPGPPGPQLPQPSSAEQLGAQATPGMLGIPPQSAAAGVAQQAAQQGYDPDTFMRAAIQHGVMPADALQYNQLMMAMHTNAAKLTSDQLDVAAKQHSDGANSVASLMAMPADQQATQYPKVMQDLMAAHKIAPEDLRAAGVDPDTFPGPAGLQRLDNLMLGHGAVIAQASAQADQAEKAAQARRDNASAAVTELQQKSLAQMQANPTGTLGIFDNMSLPPASALRYKNQGSFYLNQGDRAGFDKVVQDANTESGSLAKDLDPRIQANKVATAVAEAKARSPIMVQQAAQEAMARNQPNMLSPEAVNMAAEMYRKTGQLPAMGMGNPMARKQILDAAAQMGPVDLATEASAYGANKSSLQALTKQRDAVGAFENTAGKNLDLFLNQAGKVVDTGSPWINAPLRSVAQGALGSADLAAYNTARQVAVNEIAKVVSNPGLSGQLSDTARKEVADFNPQSATLAQTYKVAQVLRQDMANRHQAYNDQIADITARIGKGTTQEQTPATAPAAAAPAAAGMARPKTKADFDALKSGSTYIDPSDGKLYRKP